MNETDDLTKGLESLVPPSDHERRAQRVNRAVDLNARFIALTGYYGCAQREIAAAPFEWAIDPRALRWRELMTPIEQNMWECLQASGLKFYPQYPIGRFFVDFAHPGAKVIVECDGAAYHRDWHKDAERDLQLEKRGWTVLRITGRDCMHDRDDTEDDPSPLWVFARRVRALVEDRRARLQQEVS